MASANIFAQFAQPIRSVDEWQDLDMERQTRREGLRAAQRQNAIAELTARQQQRQMDDATADRNALAALAGGWTADTTPEQRIAGLRNSGRAALMTQADALEKGLIERQKGEAEARAKQAETLQKVLAAQGDLAGRVMANPTPQAAAAAIANMKAITQALGVQIDFSGDEAALGQFQTPDQIKQWAAGHALKAEQLLPKLQALNAGGQYVNQAVDPVTGQVRETGRTEITQSADNKATNETSRANNAATVAATLRGQALTDARAREANTLQQQSIDLQRAAQRTQIVDTPNGPMVVDKGTGQGRPVTAADGKPVPGDSAMKRESGAKRVLTLLDDAEKLVPGATGSYAGAAADQAARLVGAAPAGAQAIAKLKAIEGSLLAEMPRMEGPQSNFDVQMYKQAAGELGDPTAPRAVKLAAIQTIREIQQRYSGLPVPPEKPKASGSGPGAFSDPDKERRYQEWKRQQGQR